MRNNTKIMYNINGYHYSLAIVLLMSIVFIILPYFSGNIKKYRINTGAKTVEISNPIHFWKEIHTSGYAILR